MARPPKPYRLSYKAARCSEREVSEWIEQTTETPRAPW